MSENKENKKNNSPNQTENKGGRPYGTWKYTPDEMYEKSMEYFKHCDDTKIVNGFGKQITKPKTLTGLALWLGVAKDYISEKAKEPSFAEMIKYIRSQVENDLEEGALTGKYNPAIAAKNLAANFDWKEKSEVDTNIKGSLETTLNDKQMKIIANRVLNGKSSNTNDTEPS